MSHLPSASRRVLALVLSGPLVLPVALTAAVTTASAEVDAQPAFDVIAATPAEQALERARAVLAGDASEAVDATLALRDLTQALPDLDRADRRSAQAILARPNGGRQGNENAAGAAWPGPEAPESAAGDGCSLAVDLCVHWTDSSKHAPPTGDSDADDIPNQVERTLAVMEEVWAYQVDTLGFRRPLPDGRASHDDADPRFDVYLSDIGDEFIYGYCAVDDSRALGGSGYRFYDFAGYCVLDDDFAKDQFPLNTPDENLQVTAAHEFFHAVQFAYDAYEDGWFMEGGAAWIEDEIYDDVNDNLQYLRDSQFQRPKLPLDSSAGLAVYGSWGFWRYLSEQVDAGIMLAAWKRADGSPDGPDAYSLRAIRQALDRRGVDLTQVLGDFGLAIAEPRKFLDEGASYPSASLDTWRLSHAGDRIRWRAYTLDHLSFAPVRILPTDRLRNDARLRITVDLPSRSTAPVARVLVVRDNGTTSGIQRIRLDRRGGGALTVGFSPNNVRRVVLTLGNASDQFRNCWSGRTQYSCFGGVPEHENMEHWFKAVVR
jgi:hypothetical protein